MNARLKAGLLLFLLTPFVGEIVSGSVEVQAALSLRVWGLLFIAYSVPILVIREVSRRGMIGLPGQFLFGLAYGIWNEGLLAQTMMHPTGLPLAPLDGYAIAHGISWGWTALMLPWHALQSVLFPQAWVGALVPSVRAVPILPKTVTVGLGALTGGGALFLAVVREPRPQMLGCFVAMVVLVLVGVQLKSKANDVPMRAMRHERLRPFVQGFFFYALLVLGSLGLADVQVPPWVFFPFLAGVVAIYAGSAARLERDHIQGSAHLALGSFCASAAFRLLAGVTGGTLSVVVSHSLIVVGLMVLSARLPTPPSKA